MPEVYPTQAIRGVPHETLAARSFYFPFIPLYLCDRSLLLFPFGKDDVQGCPRYLEVILDLQG